MFQRLLGAVQVKNGPAGRRSAFGEGGCALTQRVQICHISLNRIRITTNEMASLVADAFGILCECISNLNLNADRKIVFADD